MFLNVLNVFKLSFVGWFFWPEEGAKIKIDTEDYIYNAS